MALRNAFAAMSLGLLSLWTLAPVQAAQPGVVLGQPNQPGYGQGRLLWHFLQTIKKGLQSLFF